MEYLDYLTRSELLAERSRCSTELNQLETKKEDAGTQANVDAVKRNLKGIIKACDERFRAKMQYTNVDHYSRSELVDELGRIQSELTNLKLHESNDRNIRNVVTELIQNNENTLQNIIQQFRKLHLVGTQDKREKTGSQLSISEPIQPRQKLKPSYIRRKRKFCGRKGQTIHFENDVQDSMRDWSLSEPRIQIKKETTGTTEKMLRRLRNYRKMCQNQICEKNLTNQCHFGDRCWRIHLNKEFGTDLEIDVNKPLRTTSLETTNPDGTTYNSNETSETEDSSATESSEEN